MTVVYTTYGLCHSVFSLSVSFSPQLVGLFENWAHLKYLFFSHGTYHRALQMLYTQLWWSNKWMIEWLPKETCLSNYWLFTYSTNIVSFWCENWVKVSSTEVRRSSSRAEARVAGRDRKLENTWELCWVVGKKRTQAYFRWSGYWMLLGLANIIRRYERSKPSSG